jgi:hypothetical protein
MFSLFKKKKATASKSKELLVYMGAAAGAAISSMKFTKPNKGEDVGKVQECVTDTLGLNN